MSKPIAGHEGAISGSTVESGTSRVAAPAAERAAAHANRAASTSLAADGRGTDGAASRQNVGITPKTVWLTSQRYRQGGLERALYERPRPGKAALLDAQHRQRIVALACGPPPEGRTRWTMRLPTEEVVKQQTGSVRGTRDHPRPVGKRRPKDVAVKKCGAWRN